jgi:hypothetical protein
MCRFWSLLTTSITSMLLHAAIFVLTLATKSIATAVDPVFDVVELLPDTLGQDVIIFNTRTLSKSGGTTSSAPSVPAPVKSPPKPLVKKSKKPGSADYPAEAPYVDDEEGNSGTAVCGHFFPIMAVLASLAV